MHVVLGIFRQVVIDDVAHAVDMNAATSDVGRNKHGKHPFAKLFQRFESFALRYFPRQHFALHAQTLQPFANVSGDIAAVREDQHSRQFLARYQIEQHLEFVFLRGEIDALIDGIHRDSLRFDRHVNRFQRPLLREVQHIEVERRRKEQRLPFFLMGRAIHNAAHIGNEAHV